MRKPFLFVFIIVIVGSFSELVYAQTFQDLKKAANVEKSDEGDETFTEDLNLDSIDVELETTFIKDPIQSYNRTVHTLNDKFYFYAAKPMCTGYNKVVPKAVQLCVRNFFSNIRMPGRLFNCLFQGKFKGAGTEGLRFVINTTIGGAGFTDPAQKYFHLEVQDEDFGQTLGHYKMENGIYIVWPLIGPSSVRGTIGFIGDIALNPFTIVSFIAPFAPPFTFMGVGAYGKFNEMALGKGETYESIVESAIDPYIAIQDSFIQNRNKKISE
ncbi:MAG: VacJ family lipoprotein [Planctomycetes bacterium]|nr:VacJ family lipoprotein [Planctomycetota bacterium]